VTGFRDATRCSVFSFIKKRPRFLQNGDPTFNAGVGRSDYSMVNSTAFGQLTGKKIGLRVLRMDPFPCRSLNYVYF